MESNKKGSPKNCTGTPSSLSITKQIPLLVSNLCLICFILFFTNGPSSLRISTPSLWLALCRASLSLMLFNFYLFFSSTFFVVLRKIKMHKNLYSFYLNLCIIFSIFHFLFCFHQQHEKKYTLCSIVYSLHFSRSSVWILFVTSYHIESVSIVLCQVFRFSRTSRSLYSSKYSKHDASAHTVTAMCIHRV